MSLPRSASSAEPDTFKLPGTSSSEEPDAPRDLLLRIVGESSSESYRVPAGRVVVLGRGGKADVDIGDASISRRHALIYNSSAVPQLVDMRSANGTWVGDKRLEPEKGVAVRPGDVIRLGSVRMVILPTNPAAKPESRPNGPPAPEVVVKAPQMREVYELAARVAQSTISVLILGETGVGKEVLAETIHRRSLRADKPFLCLNCGAFSESLLESEIFGHEKGAFTGAVQTKIGLLESADGGTVFLDEVGEMPPSLQVKLLRVLEERKITRVGDLRPRPINVRFIAATHRDLANEVALGTFRQDLFFRINGISITIPPLRERICEVPDLAEHFLELSARRAGLPRGPRLSREAVAVLEAHDWPGNIRELRNVMDRAVVLCAGDEVTPAHLQMDRVLRAATHLQTMVPPPVGRGAPPPPPSWRGAPPPSAPSFPATPGVPSFPGQPAGALRPAAPPPPPSSGGIGSEEERLRILEALERCAGNQTHAAELLGISRSTLIARLELYGIPRPRPRRRE
jgi:DNA-binding NtrC family response regulator